jgi:hypothetical protein
MSESKFDVGYGKPPVDKRFKKGKSGNPSGRPKKAAASVRSPAEKMFDDSLMEQMSKLYTVREGDKIIEMTGIEAINRSMTIAAIKGDRKIQLDLTKQVRRIQSERESDKLQAYLSAEAYKTRMLASLDHLEALGEPPPVPHPSEIKLNSSTMEVRIDGPSTQDEQEQWSFYQEHRLDLLKRIKQHEAALKRGRSSGLSESLIVQFREQAEWIDGMFPPEILRRAPLFNLAEYRANHPAVIRMIESQGELGSKPKRSRRKRGG